MSLGAAGVSRVVSTLLPQQVKQLTKRALAGHLTEARGIHHKLFPLTKSLFAEGNPVGIKHAMKVAGLDSGEMRLPLGEVSEPARNLIARLLEPFDTSKR